MVVRPAGEPALQQEVGELVQQRLEVERVGHVAGVAGVAGESHGAPVSAKTERVRRTLRASRGHWREGTELA
jgi:hypothetical protein